MPRNAQGVYSLASGNPVIPGTLIESTWANPTMSDIAAALTGSLPRDGSAGMTGPLFLSADAIQPMEAVTKQQLDTYVGGGGNYLPAGAIQDFAMSAIPTGWLLADGSAVSRTTYANLFAAIGTTYGSGNGATTFNLPDFRGVFRRGADMGRGIDPGRAVGSYQEQNNAPHTHNATVGGTAHTHGVTSAPHTHVVTAPNHTHTITDPGHTHSLTVDDHFHLMATIDNMVVHMPGAGSLSLPAGTGAGSLPYTGGTAVHSGTANTHATGVTAAAAAVTITAQAAPGIQGTTDSTAPAATVTVDQSGIEARPKNVAIVTCIKAYGGVQTDGLGSMAFQNADAVAITGGSGAFANLTCSTTPVNPTDVARLMDLTAGAINSLTSADSQVLLVDNTDPANLILRPQTNVPNGSVKLNASGQIPPSLLPIADINYQGPWDASGGETPSEAYPLVTFTDGDMYQISVAGILLVYDATGTASTVTCDIGDEIVWTVGSPTFPTSGWYRNPAPAVAQYVAGPASAVADRIAVFNGTTGKLIKDGGKTIAELGVGNVTGPVSSVDLRVAVFDGTTGDVLADGGMTIAEIVASGGSTGVFPFFLANGTGDNISLISSTLFPFFLANGVADNIPLITV